MKPISRTPRNELKRLPARAEYDRETIYAIIDAAIICHVGFVENNSPFVIPTAIMRQGENVYLHGNAQSRMLQHLGAGHEACVSVTHVDGMVLARSGFHSSINYRSVSLFGSGRLVEGEQKVELLDKFVDSLIPGRADDVRPMTKKELNITSVVEFPIQEASAKLSVGQPVDDKKDYDLPIWAGVIPLEMKSGDPIPDPKLKFTIDTPDYVANYMRGAE